MRTAVRIIVGMREVAPLEDQGLSLAGVPNRNDFSVPFLWIPSHEPKAGHGLAGGAVPYRSRNDQRRRHCDEILLFPRQNSPISIR